MGIIALFFIAALGEEVGWTGYALDPPQEKFGSILAAIILGLVWAVWHVLPLAQAHRAPYFIAWWTLGTVYGRSRHNLQRPDEVHLFCMTNGDERGSTNVNDTMSAMKT